MKTRLVQGIMSICMFGALLVGIGGYESAGAASTDLAPRTSVSATAYQALPATQTNANQSTLPLVVFGGAMSLDDHTSGTIDVVIPGPSVGHLPLTKGGKFP